VFLKWYCSVVLKSISIWQHPLWRFVVLAQWQFSAVVYSSTALIYLCRLSFSKIPKHVRFWSDKRVSNEMLAPVDKGVCFRICHSKGSGKPRWHEIKRYTSAFGLWDDVYILGGSVHTVKKNTEALVVASKNTGLEVNAEKTTWSCLEIRMQDEVTVQRLITSSFERVEEFKYLRTNLTSQNSIREVIKTRLKSRNSCYHSVQNLLSSIFLSKNLKIKTYRTEICLLFCMGLKLDRSHWGRNVGWAPPPQPTFLTQFGYEGDEMTGVEKTS